MAKRKKIVEESIHVYAYVDARHLESAARIFQEEGKLYALKNMSALLRSIVEDWIAKQGGYTVATFDQAINGLAQRGIMPERTSRNNYTPKEQKETPQIMDPTVQAVLANIEKGEKEKKVADYREHMTRVLNKID